MCQGAQVKQEMDTKVNYEVLEENGEYTFIGSVFFKDYTPTTMDIENSAVDLIQDPRSHKYRITFEHTF